MGKKRSFKVKISRAFTPFLKEIKSAKIFSVSNSVKGKVINYIRNQENHHRKLSYMDELKKFYREFGIEFKEDYLD